MNKGRKMIKRDERKKRVKERRKEYSKVKEGGEVEKITMVGRS